MFYFVAYIVVHIGSIGETARRKDKRDRWKRHKIAVRQ